LTLTRPDGTSVTITPADLAGLPQQSANDCYIISTGHGTSGPFRFAGVTLSDLLNAYAVTTWSYADVVSADGFGTRIQRHELNTPSVAAIGAAFASRPILLATSCNGAPLTRAQGLVRLIVPHETDDALRQVKWVAHLRIR
jgi:DMSO/TMAO reductase YedYZ molybdopterin-dependent catalytic subunit